MKGRRKSGSRPVQSRWIEWEKINGQRGRGEEDEKEYCSEVVIWELFLNIFFVKLNIFIIHF